MMKYLTAIVFAMFLVGCSEQKTSQVVDSVKSGVVYIANQIDATSGGSGTGFILEDNQIITNHHVIEGKGTIFVYSANSQRKYEGKVVYSDPVSDIAIVRVVDWEVFAANENPANLKLGNSDVTRQGSKVIVIGHPWGLTWSVSEGIISAKERRMGQNPKFMDQVDANLFQGNSGGPIFDGNGNVVCVSTMMLSMEGGSYGFCVPSNLVNKVVYDLNAFGEVRWRVMNITGDLTDDGGYVIVKSLEPDGAAMVAGIQEGDKILSIITTNNPVGKKVTHLNDIVTELATLKGDDETVRLAIERNGKTMTIDVKTNYKLSSDYTPDKGK